ncbi:Flagellar biosynthesis protein, FliO [Hoeflea sp. IMCC20628]|uniref:flagellar biosynthetic protein FliO n=1 Tax=Hoeflea sp. IMCC20628 TaxID=1620421 RepID=UPI00063BD7C2|nr:flagellar biosynthetic protein FliO [Hoeflea sp. IMCC20628]AKI00282.1 Flagellar biosynthesis protein, FliO [Hoeflea sp. IMCC20628]
MPDNILGGQGSTLLMAVIIVAVALLALVGVFWLIRARAASTFIRGGKNRQPRLAVLDAAAVDTRRRLVLIRRDDVEHLVMIGGPTDIVIESRISRHDDQASAPPPQHRQPGLAPSPKPAQTLQPEPSLRPAATPQPAPSRQPEPKPHPAPSPRPVAAALPETQWTEPVPQPQAARTPSKDPLVAPAATAAVAASSAGSIRSEAADALESARARVFEEPSFDEDAFDELTAIPDNKSTPQEVPKPSVPAPARTAETAQAPATSAQPDFESVLADELSGDLSLDLEDDSYLDPPRLDQPHGSDQSNDEKTPEVKPDPHPSRDSLEAEMERLLGDLSRKP